MAGLQVVRHPELIGPGRRKPALHKVGTAAALGTWRVVLR